MILPTKETIVSHAVHKSIQALFSLLLIRWNNSSFTTTSSALVKDILGQEENVSFVYLNFDIDRSDNLCNQLLWKFDLDIDRAHNLYKCFVY